MLFYPGNAYKINQQNGLAAGADDYPTKPFVDDFAAPILLAIEISKKPVIEIPHKPFYVDAKTDETQISGGFC
jgi:DNA-binding response OmpR family regulator